MRFIFVLLVLLVGWPHLTMAAYFESRNLSMVNASTRVTLYADDGFSEAWDIADYPLSGSRITGEVVGIISPVLQLNSLVYEIGSSVHQFSIGTSGLPVTLSLDGSVGWNDIQDQSVILGQTTKLYPGTIPPVSQNGFSSIAGVLTTPFGDLSFGQTLPLSLIHI